VRHRGDNVAFDYVLSEREAGCSCGRSRPESRVVGVLTLDRATGGGQDREGAERCAPALEMAICSRTFAPGRVATGSSTGNTTAPSA